MKAETLWTMRKTELARTLREGGKVDPRALSGSSYRGVSLGLPRLVERLTWKTFRKTFHADADGGVSGFNVRLIQDGLAARPRAKQRNGSDVVFGPFAVEPLPDDGTPFGCKDGVVFDYGKRHPRLHPIGTTRDVVVALDDHCDLLLGALYIEVGRTRIRTPSYFTLEREVG